MTNQSTLGELDKLSELDEIALSLVSDLELKERLEYLLENKNLGTRPLRFDDGANHQYFSNCHGTTTFALGHEIDIPEINKNSRGWPSVIPSTTSRPGYVDLEIMKHFLQEKYDEIKREEIRGLGILAVWVDFGEKENLIHTGIYLGKYNGLSSELVFHQPNTRKKFEVKTLQEVMEKERKDAGAYDMCAKFNFYQLRP